MNAQQVIHLVQPSEGENKEQSFFKLRVCSHLPGFKQNGSVPLKKCLNRIWITHQLLITVAEILVSLTFIQDYITSRCLLMALAKQSLSTINEALGCLYRHTYPVITLVLFPVNVALALLGVSEMSFA